MESTWPASEVNGESQNACSNGDLASDLRSVLTVYLLAPQGLQLITGKMCCFLKTVSCCLPPCSLPNEDNIFFQLGRFKNIILRTLKH